MGSLSRRGIAGPATRSLLAGMALVMVAFAVATTAPMSATASTTRSATATSADDPVGGVRLGTSGIIVFPGAAAALPPVVKAESYVVADADTGEVLAAKAAHALHPPASTLKTLTAITALRTLDLDDRYVAEPADEAVEGTRVGLVTGSNYTLRDLYYGMFLKSGNDAALGVAHLAGGERAFVARMNTVAQELGALDTHAVNPTGLDGPGQASSAYDLALFGRAVLRDQRIAAFARTTTYPFPGPVPTAGGKRGSEELRTLQRFVWNYAGALGVKNGYTTQAKQTLIAASRHGDRTVLVTLMRAGVGSWREAASLSDWAYANAERLEPVGVLVEPTKIEATAQAVAADPASKVITPPTSEDGAGGFPLLLAVAIGVAGAAAAAAMVRRRSGRIPTRRHPAALRRSRRLPPR